MLDQWIFVLTLLDRAAGTLGQALSGGNGLATLAALALPLLLALWARSFAHVLAALVLALLAIMLARQQAPALALAVYGLALAAAALGLPARRAQRRWQTTQRAVEQVHREMAAFLAGLDKRSMALDQPRPAPQRRETAPRPEAVPPQQDAAATGS